MPGSIHGISKTSLWSSWKEVRTELKNSTVRDVIDFLDYDINPDIWIGRLLRQISGGAYEPQTPLRFTLAKSGGFKRRLTFPAVPDIVLFRALANFVHKKAVRHQQPHVYYRRIDLQRAIQAAAQAAAQNQDRFGSIYRFTSKKSLENWRHYEQYRKQLILRKVYRFIVVSDITNFFDSVLHSEVSNALRNFPIPSRLIGLLFFLLERLAIRTDYSDSPRIGLPVDEFECSRTIANLVLFPHDRAMVSIVGENGYVRWMDDQALGANSRAEGLRIVGKMGESLSNLYLTANAKKTKILSLKQAKIHFHLEANAQLDALENEIMKRTKSRRGLVRGLAKEWRVASLQKDQGEWEKIQKRFYRLAGLIRAKFLRKRAVRDLLNAPTLTERIADYMRCSGSVTDYLKFMRRVVAHREHVHEDVELILVESLLRLEASGIRARSLLKFGLGVLEDVVALRKSPVFANPACLVVLRFGGRRTITQLRRFFREEKLAKQAQLIRASAIAYSTYGLSEFREIRKAAAVLLSNPLALMVRMIKKIQGLNQVTDRFKARLNLRRDPVGGRFYLDMRTYVAGRLLRLNKRTAVSTWLQQWAGNLVTKRISSFDRKLIRRLVS